MGRQVAGPAAREVDAYNVPELTRALDDLLGDAGLLQGMREAGLSHVKRFTWDSTAHRTHEILQRAGELGYVGGQEDMIIDIAVQLAQERDLAATGAR